MRFYSLNRKNDIYNKDQFIEEQNETRQRIKKAIQDAASHIQDLLAESFEFIANIDDITVFEGFRAYVQEISDTKFKDTIDRCLAGSYSYMQKTLFGGQKESNPTPFFKVSIFLSDSVSYEKPIGAYKCDPKAEDLTEIMQKTLYYMEKVANESPDILKMHEQFNSKLTEKIEAKLKEEKIQRGQVNSTEAMKEKKDEKKGKKGLKMKKNMGKGRNAEALKKAEEKEAKKEEVKFPKAREEKKKLVFQLNKHLGKGANDGTNSGIDFNSRLNEWTNSSSIKDLSLLLNYNENKATIDDKFNKFSIEPISEVKDLTTKLRHHISSVVSFKSELSASGLDNSIPATINVSYFIQFDSSAAKQKLLKMSDKNIEDYLEYIKEKTTTDLVSKVEKDFTTHEEQLKEKPTDRHRYKDLSEKFELWKSQKETKFKNIKVAKEIVTNLLATNMKSSGDELLERVVQLDKRSEAYSKMLENAGKMLNKQKKLLSEEVETQFGQFKTNINEMIKEFAGVVPDKIEGELQDEIGETDKAFITLSAYEKKCKEFNELQVEIIAGLKIFRESPNIEQNKDLLELEEKIKSLKNVWEIKRKINVEVLVWRRTQFKELDLPHMEEKIEYFQTELKNFSEQSNLQVYKHMKDQMELFRETVEILKSLRQDFLDQQSHWDKIQATVGEKFDYRSEEFNFEKILSLHFEQNKEPIDKHVEYANQQQKVYNGITEINNEWSKSKLAFEFSDTGNFRLLENKKMLDDLDLHLNTIANYKGMPYYDDYKTQIDSLENNLNKITNNYNLLDQVIDKWKYLKNVFSKEKTDMRQQNPTALSKFERNDEILGEIFNQFQISVFIKECLLEPQLENKLHRTFIDFEEVQIELANFLETKRNTFQRFFFLSNDDFLELLGNRYDEKIINFHLNKLFSGIDKVKVEVDTDKNGIKTTKVKRIYDSVGEELKLAKEVSLEHVAETWMKDLELSMKQTLNQTINESLKKKDNFDIKMPFEEFLNREGLLGQVLQVDTLVRWRQDMETQLNEGKMESAAYGNRTTDLKDKIDKAVSCLADKNTMLNRRRKIMAYNYILMLKNLMDTTIHLDNAKVRDVDNFEWQKILKFTTRPKSGQNDSEGSESEVMAVEQIGNVAYYGYEYVGNKERLVITALTERCFLTMMTAIFYHRGGCLQGPAGTGKTETIKDLSRSLANYLLVFNCSSKNSFTTMETIFMGLIKTGAWCCFDEFNRIQVEVLSVVRIQLSKIYDGLRSGSKTIFFKKTNTNINRDLAIFVTLNPSYEFRSDLPDNLKILFRPISVMAADRTKICEIRFQAEGFDKDKALSARLVTFFEILEMQISKQKHYDFSLRTVLSVLSYAVNLKKEHIHLSGTLILRAAITEMIVPKLVMEDVDVFNVVLLTTFSDEEIESNDNLNDKQEHFKKEIKDEIKQSDKYIGSPYLVKQIMQLNNYLNIKHGVVLVGDTQSGKTTALNILESLNKRLANKDSDRFFEVEKTKLYPKSVEIDDLYGAPISVKDNIYSDGLLPKYLKKLCNYKQGETKTTKWLLLDGPIDSGWIESMNTVLDDTKMLSLASGYRINLKDNVRIIFEAETLKAATPATVSRVGIVFFESSKLGWFPIARAWLESKKKLKNAKIWYELIAKWFDRYVYRIFDELRESQLTFLCQYTYNQMITSLIAYYEAFLPEITDVMPESKDPDDQFWEFAERLFVFSLMWAVSGPMDEQSRIKFDGILRKYSSSIPTSNPIYDFWINPEKDEWSTWEEKLMTFYPSASTAYTDLFVPTVDTTRSKALIQNLVKTKVRPLVLGPTCSGKSSIVKMVFKSFDSTKYQNFDLSFSYGISSLKFQKLLEFNFEKRNDKLFPPSNKVAICFIDDLHMPKKDEFGCQSVTEMTRQLIESNSWYGIKNVNAISIKNLQVICAAQPRPKLDNRLTSKFIPLHILKPSEGAQEKIFSTVLGFYLQNFPNEDIKKLGESLSATMIGVMGMINEHEDFLPTPTKCHYLFSLTEVTKIFEALSRIKGSFYVREYFIKLWVHESLKTISERFISNEDVTMFREFCSRQMESHLNFSLRECFIKDGKDPIFLDFLNPGSYEEVNDFEEVKSTVKDRLVKEKEFDSIVFFDQAVNYICSINRILHKDVGGHGVLIGLGGSGRGLYLKIASFLSGYETLTLGSTDMFDRRKPKDIFKDVLRNKMKEENKLLTVLIRENDLKEEALLEDINSIVCTGFSQELVNEAIEAARTDQSIMAQMSIDSYTNHLMKNSKKNIKVFVTIQQGHKFGEICRIYQKMISKCTLVKFNDWPETALIEVARNFLKLPAEAEQKVEEPQEHEGEEGQAEFNLGSLTYDLAEIFAHIHSSVFRIIDKMQTETKKHAFFSSTNFVDLINTFNTIIEEKRRFVSGNMGKYQRGLEKIDAGKKMIEDMKQSLEEQVKNQSQKQKEMESIAEKISEEKDILASKEDEMKGKKDEADQIWATSKEKNKKAYDELQVLEEAMAKFEEAAKKALSNNTWQEVRKITNTTPEIMDVIFAMTALLRQKTTNWDSAKSLISSVSFEALMNIEKLDIRENEIGSITNFTKKFNPKKLKSQYEIIPEVVEYIMNVEKYYKAKIDKERKERVLREQEASLEKAREEANRLERESKEMQEYIKRLTREKEEMDDKLTSIRKQTEESKKKHSAANLLIANFGIRGERWEESRAFNEDLLQKINGNCILASSVLIYFGIFPAKYRKELMQDYWLTYLVKKKIEYNEDFDFLSFFSTEREIQNWVLCGLPDDTAFKENAIIMKYSRNFPLLIDPQEQALNWLKQTQEREKVEIKTYSATAANGLTGAKANLNKHPLVITEVGEQFDKELTQLLSECDRSKHTLYLINKNPNPKFSPEVSAKTCILDFLVSEKGLEEQILSIVVNLESNKTAEETIDPVEKIFRDNKLIEESEEYILSELNNADDNYLDNDKLIKTLDDLEEKIKEKKAELVKSKNARDKLMNTREEFRRLARKVAKIFFVIYKMNAIDNMYEFSLLSYENLFKRSIEQSRGKNGGNESTEERIAAIEEEHIEQIIKFGNQTLFAKHRLLFFLQLCLVMIIADDEVVKSEVEKKKARIMKKAKDDEDELEAELSSLANMMFNFEEFELLISPMSEAPESKTVHKPSWIADDNVWRFLISLENKIKDFKGIMSSFTHNSVDWYKWYVHKRIEEEPLPVEWETKCKGKKNMRRLIFIKALRPDKFSTALRNYITTNLGVSLDYPPEPLDKLLINQMDKSSPLMIVHGTGIDPSEYIKKTWESKLAEEKNKEEEENDGVDEYGNETIKIDSKMIDNKEQREKRLIVTSLNQDQISQTLNDISDQAKAGGWVYLANTNLTLQNIPEVEKKLDELRSAHKDFRLIVSTNPHQEYPISFLQKCEKITFETPRGIAKNMDRLFDDCMKNNFIEKSDFNYDVFSKLVFTLSLFHSILVGRRHYGAYGWTQHYDFNTSDFNICFDILKNYVRTYSPNTGFPWEAAQNMIEVNYGSRFTNKLDLKLLKTYSKEFFNKAILSDKNYNFFTSENPILMPDDSAFEANKNQYGSQANNAKNNEFYRRMEGFKGEVEKIKRESAEMFGLHYNAEISSQIAENLELITNIRLLSSGTISTKTEAEEADELIEKLTEVKRRLPEKLALEEVNKRIISLKQMQMTSENKSEHAKYDPMLYVLYQEAERYNQLIDCITSDLEELEKTLTGKLLMIPELEAKLQCVKEDRPLPAWFAFYNSVKPLMSYMLDLNDRVTYFSNWVNDGHTISYRIGYFCNPEGLLTAIKQKHALKHAKVYNNIDLEFKVLAEDDETKVNSKNGYIFKGLYMEGGMWDKKAAAVRDENVQDLFNPLPLILVMLKEKTDQNQPTEPTFKNALGEVTHSIGPIKFSFPVYYLPVRSPLNGKQTYIMDIPLTLFKDKDKEGNEKEEATYLAYWTKKGSAIMLNLPN